MRLWRILVDCWGHHPGSTRFDIIVLARDEDEARRLALSQLSTTGRRRRVVRGSLVEILPDRARVVAQEHVTW